MGRKKNKSRKASGQNTPSATFESAKRVGNERKNEKSRKAKGQKVDRKRDQKDAIEDGLQNQNRDNESTKSKVSVGFDHESTPENRAETSKNEDTCDKTLDPEPEPSSLTGCPTGSNLLLDSDIVTSDSDVIGPEDAFSDDKIEQLAFVPQSSTIHVNLTDSVEDNSDDSGIKDVLSLESELQPEPDEVSLLAFEEVAPTPILSLEKLQNIQEPVMSNFEAQIPQANWTHRGYSLLEPKELEPESSFVKSDGNTGPDTEEDQNQQSCQLSTTANVVNMPFPKPLKNLTFREIMRLVDSEDSDSGTDTSSVVGRFKFDGLSDDDDDYQESSGQTMKDIPYVFKECRDYKQLSQERYFAMSNEEKAEKIVYKMAPSPEEIAKMDPVEQVHAIDQKRTELEVATLGDYTIGETLNEIQKFDPTAPGYSEMGIIQHSTTPLETPAGSSLRAHDHKNFHSSNGKKKSKSNHAKRPVEDPNIASTQHHKVRVFRRSEPGPIRNNKISHQTDSNHPYISKPPRTNFEAPPKSLKMNKNQKRKKQKQQKAAPASQHNEEPKESRRQGQGDFGYDGKEVQTASEYQQQQSSGSFDQNSQEHIPAPFPHQQFKQHVPRGYKNRFQSQASKEYAYLEQRERPRFRLNPDAPTFCPEKISSDSSGAIGYAQPSASTAFLDYAGAVPQQLQGPVPPASKGFTPQGVYGHQLVFGSTSSDSQLSDPAIIGFVPLTSTDVPEHHRPNYHYQQPLGTWMNNPGFTVNGSPFPPEQLQVYYQSVQDVQGPVAWNGPPRADIDSLDELLQAGISKQMLPPWWDVSKSTDLPEEYVESLNVFRNLEF